MSEKKIIREYIDHEGFEVEIADVNGIKLITRKVGNRREPPKYRTTIDEFDSPSTKIKSYPPDVFSLLKRMKPEIEKLWQDIYPEYKKQIDDPETDKEHLLILRILCSNWADNNPESVLKKEYFDDEANHLFTGSGYPQEQHVKRNLIGKLCQLLINDHLSEVIPDLKKHGVKPLYTLYTSL